MDCDFITILKDEIALEGLDGITVPTLWIRLENSPNFSLSIDDKSKEFIWECITRCSELEFYELPDPRPPLVLFNRYDHMDVDLGILIEPETAPEDIYPYVPVDRNNVRGSCKTFKDREKITSRVRRCCMSLDEVTEKWGDKFVIVASQELRNMSLLGDEVSPTLELGLIQYCILERIGRTRFHGEVTQGKIGLMSMGIPPKSMFYYRKTMLCKKLITKQHHFQRTHQGQTVSGCLLHLKRFYVERRSKMEAMMINMCDLLAKAPNKRELFHKIRAELGLKTISFKKLFGKFWQPCIRTRFIPHSEMYPDSERVVTANGAEKLVKIVELLKPYRHEDDLENEEEDGDANADEAFFDPQRFVYDLPFLTQVYNVVEAEGPEGISSQDLGKRLGLPKLEVRLLLRNLERKGAISSIMEDQGKQRVYKYISTDLVKASGSNQQLEEAKQKIIELANTKNISDEMIEMDVSLVLEKPEQNGSDKATVAVASEDIIEVVIERENKELEMWPFQIKELHPSGSKKKNIAHSRVTYRMLKRANLIIETVRKAKLVGDLCKIHKLILQEERKEGLKESVDRKSCLRIIHRLVKDGFIKSVRTVLRLGKQVKKLHFLCDPSLKPDDPLMKSAIEQAKFKAFCNNKQVVKFFNQDLQSKPDSISESIRALRSISKGATDVKLVYSPSMGRSYGLEPKFIRLKYFFQLLFYLVYDYTGEEPAESETEFPKYHSGGGWKTHISPLPKHCGVREGWCLISDVILRMPLSILLKIVNITHKVEGLEEFLIDDRQHCLLHQIPRKICNLLLYGRKYLFIIHEAATRLAHMGLLSFGPQECKEKDQIFVFVHRHASIKNTSISPPGFMHISKDLEYFTQKYYFKTLQDVESFWFDLETVCLHTQLGSYNSAKGQSITITSASRNPPLVEACRNKEVEEVVDSGTSPGDGLGAGGLDSTFFAHLRRNWIWPSVHNRLLKTLNSKWQKRVKPTTDGAMYMKYLVQGGDDKAQSASSKNKRLGKLASASRLSLYEGKEGTMIVPVTIEPNLPKPKGQKRKLETPSTSASKKSKSDVEVRVIDRKPARVRQPYYDETDLLALKSMKKHRVDWSVREDSFLLLCKVASLFLHPHAKGMVVSFNFIRNLLHEHCPEVAFNKTSKSCQRRLYFMLKNPTTVENVSVFLGEAKQDMDLVQQFDGPKPPLTREELWQSRFATVMQCFLNKFTISSTDEYALKPSLPSSVAELDKKYNVLVTGKIQESVVQHVEPKNVVDIHCSTVTSLLVSTFCIQDSKTNWTFSLYKLYQQYPDSLLRSIVAKLTLSGVIARKKFNMKRSVERHVLLSSIPYRLSIKFEYSLLPRYQNNIYEECFDELGKLTKTPDDGWLQMEKDVSPGSCALMLSLAVTNSLEMDISVPDPIIIFKLESKNLLSKDQEKSGDKSSIVSEVRHKVAELIDDVERNEKEGPSSSTKGSRFALYLMRQQISNPIGESTHHNQDYFVIDSCTLNYRLSSPFYDSERSSSNRYPKFPLISSVAKDIVISQSVCYKSPGKEIPIDDIRKVFVAKGKDAAEGLLIYEYISQRKELGVTILELVEFYGSKSRGVPLNVYVKLLKEAKAIVQGGVNVIRYISVEYCDPWILKSIKIPKDKKMLATSIATKLPKRLRVDSANPAAYTNSETYASDALQRIAHMIQNSQSSSSYVKIPLGNATPLKSNLLPDSDVIELIDELTSEIEARERTLAEGTDRSINSTTDRYSVIQNVVEKIKSYIEQDEQANQDVLDLIEDLYEKTEMTLSTQESISLLPESRTSIESLILDVIQNIKRNLEFSTRSEEIISSVIEAVVAQVEEMADRKCFVPVAHEKEIAAAVLNAVKSIVKDIELLVTVSHDFTDDAAQVVSDVVYELIDKVNAIVVTSDNSGGICPDSEKQLVGMKSEEMQQMIVDVIEKLTRDVFESSTVTEAPSSDNEIITCVQVLDRVKDAVCNMEESTMTTNDKRIMKITKDIIEKLKICVSRNVLENISDQKSASETLDADKTGAVILDIIESMKVELEKVELPQLEGTTNKSTFQKESGELGVVMLTISRLIEKLEKELSVFDFEPVARLPSEREQVLAAVCESNASFELVANLLEALKDKIEKADLGNKEADKRHKIEFAVKELVESLKNKLEEFDENIIGKSKSCDFQELDSLSGNARRMVTDVMESIINELDELDRVENGTQPSSDLPAIDHSSDETLVKDVIELIGTLKKELDKLDFVTCLGSDESQDRELVETNNAVFDVLENLKLKLERDNAEKRPKDNFADSREMEISSRLAVLDLVECLKKTLETLQSDIKTNKTEDLKAVVLDLVEAIKTRIENADLVEGLIKTLETLESDRETSETENAKVIVLDLVEAIKTRVEKAIDARQFKHSSGPTDKEDDRRKIILDVLECLQKEFEKMEVSDDANDDSLDNIDQTVASVVESLQEIIGKGTSDQFQNEPHHQKDDFQDTGLEKDVFDVLEHVQMVLETSNHILSEENFADIPDAHMEVDEDEEHLMMETSSDSECSLDVRDTVLSVIESVVALNEVNQNSGMTSNGIEDLTMASKGDVLEEETRKVRTSGRCRKRPLISTDAEEKTDVFWVPVNFVCRAWRKPDGSLNRQILQKLMSALLGYIMTFPGIEESELFGKIAPAIQPVQILEILDMLIQGKCIQRFFLSASKVSLFDEPVQHELVQEFHPGSSVHYEAEPHAIVRFAQLSEELSKLVLHH